MFHSRHDSAALHAAARALSGGPVYVSDRVGDHDFQLLRRLVLPDGSVLRCLLPARPSPDCLFADVSRDRATALKVWNLNPCTGLLGAFNVQGAAWSVKRRAYRVHDRSPPALRVGIGPADVPHLGRVGRCAVWSDARQVRRQLCHRCWRLHAHICDRVPDDMHA
jgi:raffinose synthase